MVRMGAGSVNAKPCYPATFSPGPGSAASRARAADAMRVHSGLDRVLERADSLLRAATRTGARQQRPTPGQELPEPALDNAARRRAAGLMRVNHAGEVCAQALYVSQAALARDEDKREALLQAAREEGDHLYWCEQRLAELHSHTSRLDPLWFVGSCAIGMVAAAVGDRWSLGFVEETERQVVAHLEGHLGRLPEHDLRSRAIVAMMRDDEQRHADDAQLRGAAPLPAAVRGAMGWTARVMTTVSYWM